MKEIKNIVYTPDLETTNFICNAQKQGMNCIKSIDARSAVYMATGICARNRLPIIVCINSSNDSRSAFSGMTEAYYNNLPVILITFGKHLDYSTELKDAVKEHFIVSTEDDIFPLLNNHRGPIHIELLTKSVTKEKHECSKIQTLLSSVLSQNEYLYFGQGVIKQNHHYECKTVVGGMPNCYDGAISNVLGASLAKSRRRYIGLISEEEIIHDMNSFGNININNRLTFIVIAKNENKALIEYLKAQELDVDVVYENLLHKDNINRVINSAKTSLLFVIKESL